MGVKVNPMQLIQMMRQGQNPQQVMMNVLDQQDAPVYKNLANLARNNQAQEIEMIVRNIAREKGIDYDSAFNNFKQMLGIK